MSRPDTAPGRPVLFIYRLKPGAGPEYDRMHAAVWPEIRDLIDRAGIHDYEIWRHEEIVVSRLRTRDGYDHAAAVTAASEAQARWTQALSHLFESIEDGSGEPLWLDRVFSHRARADAERPE